MAVNLVKRDLVACPECGGSSFDELAYRFTWQPVTGLRRDADADDYSSFDYGDDVFVVGWDCKDCGWATDQVERLDLAFAEAAAEACRQVRGLPRAATLSEAV